MRGLVRRCAAAILGVGALATIAAAAPAEIYPLSKVKRGQTGYGMTTFSGTTPEKFTFEVVSVIRNFLPKQDIILVKTDDPKLAVSSFWQGMSGSPLYIDGKVACAFSYGFPFGKTALGGCTPIEYMLKDGDTHRRVQTQPAATKGGPRMVVPAAATMGDWRRLTPSLDASAALDALGPARSNWLLSAPLPSPVPTAAPIDANGAMRAGVPFAVSGFGGRAFAALERMFGDSNLMPLRAGGTAVGKSGSETGPKQFVMGGSIAVDVIRGDMSGSATGTVSYVDGNKVLAFGHPMFQTGETYAPVSTSYVHGVVANARMSYVLASPVNEIGSLVQDRQSSITADTNLRTPTVPVDIVINTASGSGAKAHTESGTFHVELMTNKFFTPQLAAVALMNAIGYYLPDRDDVTARVESTVRIKGAQPLTFVDYMYANDGAGSVMGAVRGLRVLIPLFLNPYAPVTVERVDIKVDLRFEANFGEIKEVKLPTAELVPGARNTLKVVMRTYDGKDIVEDVPVDVPASLAGSIVQLEVTAGDSAKLDAAPPVDLPSLIAAFRKLLPGNVWAVTLYPADEGFSLEGKLVRDLPPSAADKLRPQTHTPRAQPFKVMSRTVAPAKRVVNGATTTLVRIGQLKK